MGPIVTALSCPVCSAPLARAADRCDYCGAWVVISVDHPAIDPASIDRGRIDQHIAGFRAALKRDPGDAAAHYGLGIAYFNLGLPHEAADELTEAARLTPERPAIQVMLGVVLADLAAMGDGRAAALAAERALRALVLDRGNVEAHLLQARLAAAAGDDPGMLASLRAAAERDREAIRPAAAAWLSRHAQILATAPQFLESLHTGASGPRARARRERNRSLVSSTAAAVTAIVASAALDPAAANADQLSTIVGLVVLVGLAATIVFALRWLLAQRAAARLVSGGRSATLEREITPFLTGAVQDPLRLLGAIDYVIQERERQRLIAAHQAAAAAPQRR